MGTNNQRYTVISFFLYGSVFLIMVLIVLGDDDS